MRNNSVRIHPTKGDLVRQAIAVAAALATMALVVASASARRRRCITLPVGQCQVHRRGGPGQSECEQSAAAGRVRRNRS